MPYHLYRTKDGILALYDDKTMIGRLDLEEDGKYHLYIIDGNDLKPSAVYDSLDQIGEVIGIADEI